MTKRLQSPLLLACASLLLFATVAEAQVARPFKTPYISARVGLSLYGGDLDNNPDNAVFSAEGNRESYFDNAGIAAAGEIGYQFTPSLAFGVAFNYGNYPALQTVGTRFTK